MLNNAQFHNLPFAKRNQQCNASAHATVTPTTTQTNTFHAICTNNNRGRQTKNKQAHEQLKCITNSEFTFGNLTQISNQQCNNFTIGSAKKQSTMQCNCARRNANNNNAFHTFHASAHATTTPEIVFSEACGSRPLAPAVLGGNLCLPKLLVMLVPFIYLPGLARNISKWATDGERM